MVTRRGEARYPAILARGTVCQQVTTPRAVLFPLRDVRHDRPIVASARLPAAASLTAVPFWTWPERGRGAVRRAAWLACLWVGLVAGLALVRQSGVPSWQTPYAEDGTVFLSAAYDPGGAGVLLEPYNGYLHLAPRLVAAAGRRSSSRR